MSRAVSNEGGSLCPGPPQSGGQQSKGPITAVSIPEGVEVVSRTFPGGTTEAWGQTGDESWSGGQASAQEEARSQVGEKVVVQGCTQSDRQQNQPQPHPLAVKAAARTDGLGN